MQSKGFAFALGHIWAQGLFFLTLPFVSRLYTSNPVADWTILQSLCLLIWSFSALKTDLSMVQAENNHARNDLFLVGFASHLLVSCFVLFCLKLDYISLKTDHYWIIFVGICSYGFQQLVCARLLAQRFFRKLLMLRIATACLIYPCSLLLVSAYPTSGLLLAWSFGHLFPTLLIARLSGLNLGTNLSKWSQVKPTLQEIWQKNSSTLTLGSLDGLITSSAQHLFLLFLSWHYSSAVLLAYFVAMRFVSAPVSLMAAGTGSLNYVHFQQLHSEKRLDTQPIFAFWKQWWPAALIYFGALVIMGTYFFPWYQGNHATEAPQLVVPLAVFGALQFLTSPISSVFYVLKQMRYPMFLNIFTMIRLALAWWMMSNSYPLLTVIWVFTAIALLHLFLYNYLQVRALSDLST
jgi:hypothetical protein